jgi:predicted SAM-dependent methyltransferase
LWKGLSGDWVTVAQVDAIKTFLAMNVESLIWDGRAAHASVRKLHIGGVQSKREWEILNANPGPGVDHVGDAKDLSRFSDNTFSEIYASHVLEHIDYRDDLLSALKDWHRVLRSEGRLYVSVPDLDVLSYLILQKDQLSMEDRFLVMRMMFGGHIDRYDYHQVGLNQEFLGAFLIGAGFRNLRKVESFGLFDDTSETVLRGVRISLNLVAEKAGP